MAISLVVLYPPGRNGRGIPVRVVGLALPVGLVPLNPNKLLFLRRQQHRQIGTNARPTPYVVVVRLRLVRVVFGLLPKQHPKRQKLVQRQILKQIVTPKHTPVP